MLLAVQIYLLYNSFFPSLSKSNFSGESIYLNWDIKPIVNEDSISLYAGTLPTHENEILISRKIYSNLSNKNIIDREI